MPFWIMYFGTIALLTAYLGWRLVLPSGLNRRQKALCWLGLLVSFLLHPLSYALRFLEMDMPLANWVVGLAYLSVGAVVVTASVVFIRDMGWLTVGVLRLPLRIWRRNGTGTDGEAGREPCPERRAALARMVNAGVLVAAGGLTGYGVYGARRVPPVKRVEVRLANLPPAFDGYRIVQLTDMHVGPTIGREWVEGVVARANSLGADLVAVTGDMVDDSVARLRDSVAPMRDLSAPDGVFYVTGNHEYYHGGLDWTAYAAVLGMRALTNEHVVLRRGAARMVLGGVTDFRMGKFFPGHASSPMRAFEGAPPSVAQAGADGVTRVLLAHQPKSVFAAVQAGADFVFSGHTHGGQFFPGTLMIDWFQPYVKGLYDVENAQLYVSCGTGYWGPPIRLGAPSEITEITLAAR